MKKLLLLVSFVTILYSAKAQLVIIPDAHFATWLNTHYPSCMVGNQMNGSCTAIQTAYSLQFASTDSIADLSGVQYFIGLQILQCNSNQLTTIPQLPSTLVQLECMRNHLTSLPSLPNTLTQLHCDNNLLTSLPTLPNSLAILNCWHNQLTSLPILPNGINSLECSHNLLTSLPTIPNSLWDVRCGNNLLTSLPSLCSNTGYLICDSNNISCFPIFPNSITNIDISNNPFTCLPNYIAAMNSISLAYPLCVFGDLLNNPNNCVNGIGIVGYIYKDNNGDCVKNTVDSLLKNVHEKIYDVGNNLLSQTYSAINGVFDFPETMGTYTVKIDTAGMPFTAQCIYPGIDSTVTLTTANPLITDVNFPVTCKPGFDIGVQSVVNIGRSSPGHPYTLKFVAGDFSNWYNLHCASGISGQVIITITGPVTYNSTLPGSLIPSVVGNVFTYNIANFGTINSSTAFGLIFTNDSTAQAGDIICVSIVVTPTIGDNDINNNTYNYCYQVFNSWDPNYKETYPETVQPGFTDYFTYTIHFQNTGTAAAINIHLQDTLDANLDLNTFQVINYSHSNTTWLNGNKLSFNFPNINLPDSTSDFNGSQGFVQYRIKPLAGLPAGTLIHNRASIYFDFNAPVVTNTTTNEYMSTVGNGQLIMDNGQLTISPNPTSGLFTIISTKYKVQSIKITDVVGNSILQSTIDNKQSTIDMGGFAKGIYFVKITDENKNSLNKKIIIQ